jgi:CheY-like chemotaxis protein
MDGTIWVESQLGQGATFHFTMMATAVSPTAVTNSGQATDTSPPDDQLSTLRILLAEDNKVNQQVALHMLRRLGCEADVANNGREVLQHLARHNYDLIFMDVQMPEMDGLETTRAIRQQVAPAGQPIIIAMTANALPGDRETYLATGMDDYLSKPVTLDRLAAVLRKYC